MSKAILLSKIAGKQLGSLPEDIRNKVRKVLYSLIDPEKGGMLDTKKLKGVRGGADLVRLMIGNYRVVYFEDVDSFRIIQIFHRGKGYKWL
ncbi:MAG: type II toxin-antitoxin system RelE/ParE family toxin [Methanosarcinales archaeon]|nr:MAG: type II toxin-antitoxin system RelE/ParE family toxin [Methanosarcinales archaeon]